MTHTMHLEQEGGVYYLSVEGSDAPESYLERKCDYASPVEANVQPIDLEELDREGPEAAEVELATMGRNDDDDVPDGDLQPHRERAGGSRCGAPSS